MEPYVLSATLALKDQFSATISSAASKFKKMDNDISAVASSIKKSIKEISVQDIKSAQFKMNAGIAAIGTGAAYTLKSFYMGYVDLNEQLTRNNAITGTSVDEQALLKKQVEELGASTKFTALEVAKAQMYQAMAGYKTNEILEVTPTLMKLAIATGEDFASTSDMVTDNLSAFGLSVSDAAMFADTLANVANNTNTTVGMLGNAFTYVGAASTAIGEDFREVATMLGILADNGIKGEKAGTALRGLYTRLANPTSEMQKQLNKVGLELYDQNGKFKGLRKIIEESRPALAKLTEEERNQWLTIIAGTEGMTGWTAILNNSVESTKKAKKAAYEATGSLEKFVGIMNTTDRQAIDELSSAWDGFKTKVGDALSPIVLEKMKEVTDYINKLSSSDTFSTENMRNFFSELVDNAKLTVAAIAGINLVMLGIRASIGDATAIAQLTGLGIGAVTAGGMILWKKSMEEEEKEKRVNTFKEGVSKTNTGAYSATDLSGAQYGLIRQPDKLPEKIEYERFKNPNLTENDLGNFDVNFKPSENIYLKQPFDINSMGEKNIDNNIFTENKNSTEKTFNLNFKLDVTGLDNANTETVEEIAKRVFRETLEITNLSMETQM